MHVLGNRMERTQAVAQQTTYAVSAGLIGLGTLNFTVMEWVAIGGFLLGVLTYFTSSAIQYWRAKNERDFRLRQLKILENSDQKES